MDRQQAIRYFNGLARGLGPDNLGAPVDAAAAALNLGLAGVGYVGHKTGLLKEPLGLIEKPVGGSDWIAEKLGNADDGSGAYTAGRLTPLAVGLARMGGRGAVKAVDKALTGGPAAHGKAAQRGAIRISRGPGDNPQQDLVLSTSLNQEALPDLMTKGGDLELYSPSFGVTRNRAMDAFGDLALIPKLGAFDPATSPSTLFNRDAYTARFSDFSGKTAAKALKGPTAPLNFGDRPFESKLRTAFHPSTLVQGVPIDKSLNFGALAKRYREIAAEKGEAYAIDRLRSLDSSEYSEALLDDYSHFARAIGNNETYGAFSRRLKPYLPNEAVLRLRDRLHLGVRPEDLRFNEGSTLGDSAPGAYMDPFHRIAVQTSPAFRSFRAYERSPLGAGLLRDAYQDPVSHQNRVLDEAFGADYGWLSREAKKELINSVPAGQGEFRDLLGADRTYRSQTVHSYLNNGFGAEEALADLQGLYEAATKARRGIARTPSEYAELKVLGSVPVNADTFAGAMVQHGAMPETERILKYLGLPVIEKVHSWTPEQELEAIAALQRGMAAPRQPAK